MESQAILGSLEIRNDKVIAPEESGRLLLNGIPVGAVSQIYFVTDGGISTEYTYKTVNECLAKINEKPDEKAGSATIFVTSSTGYHKESIVIDRLPAGFRLRIEARNGTIFANGSKENFNDLISVGSSITEPTWIRIVGDIEYKKQNNITQSSALRVYGAGANVTLDGNIRGSDNPEWKSGVYYASNYLNAVRTVRGRTTINGNIWGCGSKSNTATIFYGGAIHAGPDWKEKNPPSAPPPEVVVNGNLENCYGKHGGGLYASKATCTVNGNVVNCETVNNPSNNLDGGGIYCQDSSSVTVNGSIIKCSTKRNGGGVYCKDSSVVVTGVVADCTAKSGSGSVHSGTKGYVYAGRYINCDAV